ncbi:Carboxylesterase ybfK [Anaerotruncus sp. 2789STDY5834896]|uniref:Carboxylesterase ybfK n=1 Tax=uncultured Anaerotruncus sp. TaxID=905011 RepID=A0A1C6GEJ0_9FIRM|nr:Carboxylesterase ybfK [uncultured Anaerotruncus sp.]
MGTIYKTPDSRRQTLALYDRQLRSLGCHWRDRYVDTTFGRTHLVETGNFAGPAVLVFHGGNSTTAYNLLLCRFLLPHFHLYAVDIIGHPGKSDQRCLPPYGYAYGRWASQVIDALGFARIRCFGGSFGGGVLAKLMCVAPEKVEKSVLVVPAGIGNALPVGAAKMLVPLLRYRHGGDERYLRQTALYMAMTEDVLDGDTIETLQNSFDHVKTKVGMPTNVGARRMRRCHAPTLVLAGERDCLFPARKVLRRAPKILPCCRTYQLTGRGHMHLLTEKEQAMIVSFLQGDPPPPPGR